MLQQESKFSDFTGFPKPLKFYITCPRDSMLNGIHGCETRSTRVALRYIKDNYRHVSEDSMSSDTWKLVKFCVTPFQTLIG